MRAVRGASADPDQATCLRSLHDPAAQCARHRVDELTTLLDEYAESSDEAATVMFDLVGLSDWTADTAEEEITRYGEILAEFQG